MGKIDRVKRQLLTEAVADNLDTIRGLPPRSLRSARRVGSAWLRRAPLLMIAVVLAGSTFVAASRHDVAPSQPLPVVRSQIVPVSSPRRPRDLAASQPADIHQPLVSASAFPLSVRRVVLDAGHGGSDPGTSGGTLTEK